MLVVDVLIKAEHSEVVARGLERQAQEANSRLRSGVVTGYTQALHVWDKRISSASPHGKRSSASDDKSDHQQHDTKHHKSDDQQHTTASATTSASLLSLPSFSLPSLPQMPWQKESEAEDASDTKRCVNQELRYNRPVPTARYKRPAPVAGAAWPDRQPVACFCQG